MQCQRRYRLNLPTSALPTWQRAVLTLSIAILLFTLLTAFVTGNAVHARNVSGQRDRRPDREVRVRYPKPPRAAATAQSNRPSLQRTSNAPAVPSVDPSSTPVVESTNDESDLP